MMSNHEKPLDKEASRSPLLNGSNGPISDRPTRYDDYTGLPTTVLDRYGRHSQACRHNTTGEIIAMTELNEAATTYEPQRNFFHRWDQINCVTIWIFRPIYNWNMVVGEVVGVLFLPFMVAHVGYAYLMFMWDHWRAGSSGCDEQ